MTLEVKRKNNLVGDVQLNGNQKEEDLNVWHLELG